MIIIKKIYITAFVFLLSQLIRADLISFSDREKVHFTRAEIMNVVELTPEVIIDNVSEILKVRREDLELRSKEVAKDNNKIFFLVGDTITENKENISLYFRKEWEQNKSNPEWIKINRDIQAMGSNGGANYCL